MTGVQTCALPIFAARAAAVASAATAATAVPARMVADSIAARGEIDPRRVGITGGSYGGYLTLLALARTPDLWRAGVERYGMPDLVADYLLGHDRFGPWYETEMGNPKTDAALFRERSPLLYLDSLKAPLLIFQGANDNNVPRAESDLLVALLKGLGKAYEYVVYDDEGHGFTRRKNLLDHHRRALRFFVKHLSGSGPPPPGTGPSPGPGRF